MNTSLQIVPEHRPSLALDTSRLAVALCLLCLPLAWSNPAAAQDPAAKYPTMAPLDQYLMADKASEIALARTAAPNSLSANATILTLGKSGYETAVQGTNGFTCFVQRSWSADFGQAEFWNTKVRQAQCWNSAATSSVLPEYLKRTQWVLAGVSVDEMAARTKAALAAHEIGTPAPGSVVYMLSKEQYIQDSQANWYPHIMFFVPAIAGVEGSAWGANLPGVLMYAQTSTTVPITTYFLLSPRWSDGTLGPYAPKPSNTDEHHHH